jgi:hypothetical protein
VPAGSGQDWGATLTSLFSNTYDVSIVSVPEKAAEVSPASKSNEKKRGMLPLLTVLFLISYALMTMLIIEQGQTIESQRALIRELFRDSTELSSIKQGQIAKKNSEMRAQAPSAQVQSNQVQTNQTPSTQAQEDQAPYSQALPQHQSQKQSQKQQFRMPSRPASDLMDENRSVITI